MDSTLEKIFKELSEKYNKPVYVIQEIYFSEFRKLKEEVKKNESEVIKLPNWGKYIINKSKLIKYKNKHGNAESQNNKDNTI